MFPITDPDPYENILDPEHWAPMIKICQIFCSVPKVLLLYSALSRVVHPPLFPRSGLQHTVVRPLYT